MWKTAIFTLATAVLGTTTIALIEQAGQSRTMTYEAFGVVRTAPERGRIRISHDDIPGYMPAMTMEFVLGEGKGTALAPGDRVRFVVRIGPDRSWIENVEVTGKTTGAGADGCVEHARSAAPGRRDPAAVARRSGWPATDRFCFQRTPHRPDLRLHAVSGTRLLPAAVAAVFPDPSGPGHGWWRTRDVRLLSVTIDPILPYPHSARPQSVCAGRRRRSVTVAIRRRRQRRNHAPRSSVLSVRRTQRRSARSHARDRSRGPGRDTSSRSGAATGGRRARSGCRRRPDPDELPPAMP